MSDTELRTLKRGSYSHKKGYSVPIRTIPHLSSYLFPRLTSKLIRTQWSPEEDSFHGREQVIGMIRCWRGAGLRGEEEEHSERLRCVTRQRWHSRWRWDGAGHWACSILSTKNVSQPVDTTGDNWSRKRSFGPFGEQNGGSANASAPFLSCPN